MARQGAGDFQIAARGGVEIEGILRTLDRETQHMGQRTTVHFLAVDQHRAGGGDGRFEISAAIAVQITDAELLRQAPPCRRPVETPGRQT